MLSELFKSYFGTDVATTKLIAGAGSNRRYVRLADNEGHTAIGVEGTSLEENHAFIYLSEHLKKKNIPVPQIYAVSDNKMEYLQEDLGSLSLYDALAEGRSRGGNYGSDEIALIEKTIRLLAHVQVEGASDIDWSHCYPQQSMDKRNVSFDLNYFKYCFLKPLNIDFNEDKLEDDFLRLASDIVRTDESKYFLYRDFQARNIMLEGANRNPYLIDYQGARRGSVYYDVASFLWQASARYNSELREQMIKAYYDELTTLIDIVDYDSFRYRLATFVFFRQLQVLGAYGFRGYFERKEHFLQSIPPALTNIRHSIDEGIADGYPCLKSIVERICSNDEKKSSDNVQTTRDMNKKLRVRIFSFSYKKGIPADCSGNGGGYVFDCRSTHNPGRYEQYKHLTGLDKPVRDFLEKDGEILVFLKSVAALADHHVERYIQRGFTDLMFSFGCTGGQHRSVYSADWLAHHLNDKYGIEVELCHREQNINTTLICKQ